jgi:outer membrane protein
LNRTTESGARQWFSLEKIAAAILLLILGTQGELMKAQGVSSGDQKLTVVDAVELALKQNLNIQIANIESATQQQDRVIARSELLPHANFDASDAITRYNTKAQLGVQPSIIPHSIGPYQAVHVGPTFSAPVFDLTLIHQYEASGHHLLATRADEQTVREETVLLTVSQYMAHLSAVTTSGMAKGAKAARHQHSST